MDNNRVNEKVRFDALLYAIFAALLPLNQAVKLPGGTTINQVTGVIVLIVFGLNYIVRNRGRLTISREFMPVYLSMGWNFLCSMWSISGFSLPINLMASYLMLLMCFKRGFNSKELNVIKWLIITVYAAFSLYIVLVASQNSLRAVLFSKTGEADPNSLALTLSVAIILSLDTVLTDKKRLYPMICMLAVSMAVLFTGSRTGIIAALIAAFYLTMQKTKHSRKHIITIFFIILALYVTLQILIDRNIFRLGILDRLTLSDITETGGNGRVEIWKIYLRAIFANPIRTLIGYGTGSYTDITYMYSYRRISPHNDYIGYAATLGVIGLCIFIALFVAFIKKGKKNDSGISVALIILLMVGCITIRYFEDKAAFNMLILAWQFAMTNERLSNANVGDIRKYSQSMMTGYTQQGVE